MAGDLVNSPRTDLEVMACGDMHLMNFGLFASAERNLIFAINDFDEVLPGPWEWDLKRLAASAAVAALFLGGDRADAEQAARAVVEAYVRRIRSYAEMGFLEVWYDLIDEKTILAAAPQHLRKLAQATFAKARARGHIRALDRLTEEVNGENRIVEDVPLIVRAKHLPDGTPMTEALETMLRSYLASLPEDRRRLLSRYRIVDVARKVVGVGSVGTSCWVVLLEEQGADSPLFLQIKEARESVLARYFDSKGSIKQQGRRVVIGQRMIQGSPDIFLGWGPVNPVNGRQALLCPTTRRHERRPEFGRGRSRGTWRPLEVLWPVRLGARACSCEVGRRGNDLRLLRHRRCASGCHRKIFVGLS